MNANTRWPRIAALLTLVAAVVFIGAVASDADAQGVTPQQLQAHGWTCIVPPPPLNNRLSCFNPGTDGRSSAIPILQRRTAPSRSTSRQARCCLPFT